MKVTLLRAVLLRLFVCTCLCGLGINAATGQINVVWTGLINSDWHTATNWLPPLVPSLCNHYVVIPRTANQPVISANVNVGRIQLADSVNLILNADLTVCGDWIGPDNDEASVTGNGKVVMDGMNQHLHGYTAFNILAFRSSDTTRLDSGGHLDILIKLNLTNGVFDVTRGTLRFPSTSPTNYSILDNFSPGFVGKLYGSAIAERYIPVAGLNQHFFGTPVANTTFAAMGATGTPGYVIPTYNCDQNYVGPNSPYGHIFQWHDDVPANATCLYNGWEVKTSGVAEPGRAYSTYLSGGLFSITGTINQDSVYTLSGMNNIGWTSNTLQTAGFFPPAYESGWHLVANPYLASLELAGHTPDFDAAAVWVTSGPFSGTYQPLAITGGAVPPFQGFVVHRSSASAVDFSFRKSECTDVANLPFYKLAGQQALNITVSGNGFNDITYIRYDESATTGYDVNYDNRKPLSVFGQPTLYTFNSNPAERLSVNVNRSISETPDVRMNFIPGSAGTFTLHWAGLTSFDPTSYIWLEDIKTGQWINLRSQSDYTFTATVTDSHTRFVLHFTPAVNVVATDASCQASGHLSVQQPGNTSWSYTIAAGNVTIASGILSNATPVALSLSPGVYTITLPDTAGYIVIKNTLIQGTQAVMAAISASRQNAETEDEIVFTGPADAMTYTWDMGDGTLETTPVVTHAYTSEGAYSVNLTVTTSGNCSASGSMPVNITAKTVTGLPTEASNEIRVYTEGNTVVVSFGGLKKVDAQVAIYNLLGQVIQQERFVREGGYYRSTLPGVQSGYVIVQINNKGIVTTKKVFIDKLG